ncbi:DNA-binding transcriptional LysR family regulator [Agrobacterium vitis]|nr:DNA-binding transcriptional LysR family regulator [Agrobacterium vitis]MBE1437327.1 DNA-binding transcriptional LysR family regulator [Agrobacterium vitis]
MIELRHLRYAIAVADEGHMTRAALKLGLQQPPLSQQIKALEAMIGTALFQRQPKGMALTDAGEAFIARARQIIVDMDGAVEAAQRAARGETGHLAIGFTTSAAFHPLVSSVVRALRLSSPELVLRLDEGSTQELLAELAAGRLDTALIRSATIDLPGFRMIEVDREQMVLALPDTHSLAASHQPINLADLKDEIFVLYRRPSAQGLYDRIIAACQRAGFSPKVGQEAPKVVSTLSLVAAGLGLSIIPQSIAQLETSGVAYRRFEGSSGLEAPLYLAYREDVRQGPLAIFVKEVMQQAKAR